MVVVRRPEKSVVDSLFCSEMTACGILHCGSNLSGGTQVWRDPGFDFLKFFRGEREFVPAFEKLARSVSRNRRIGPEQDPVHPDLAHSLHQERGAFFPHAVDGNAGRVKIKMLNSRVSALDRVRIDTKRIVDYGIVTTGTSEVGDLDGDVRGRREQAFEKNARLLRPVGPVV